MSEKDKVDTEVEGKTVSIHVKQLVADEDLHYDQEENPKGIYEVVVPVECSPELAATIARDAFACEIPIKVPDNFEIWTTVDGERIDEDESLLKTYTREKDTLCGVHKVSDEVE